MTDTDIVIAGGGIAGLSAAASFGAAGFDVICVDPLPMGAQSPAEAGDLRTTAILQPAHDLLDSVGIWQGLAPFASALHTMRIVDAGGQGGDARVVREFHASDLSDRPFGWNVPNRQIRRVLVDHIAEMPQVTFRSGVSVSAIFTRESAAQVTFSDGERISARLVIAADGRDSPLRTAAGISVSKTRYGQKALAFAVTHANPHNNVSTEIHRTGGPFTLVPLPDHDGRPCSAVVWMDEGPRALARMRLSDAAFEAEMTDRSCGLLGPLTLASPRSIWPIISQTANRISAERLALIAEAAHVVPPIGAQGLNMSLADLDSLLGLARKNPEALGDQAMLDAYARARTQDIRMRVRGIDLLNRASMARARPLRDARAAGLGALYALKPLRHTLMQMGLGIN